MWTAVYMIEGLDAAEKIEKKLKSEGFLVKIKPFSKEGDTTIYKIMAPEFEAEEVQCFLLDLGY